MKKKYITVEFFEADFEEEEPKNIERKKGYMVFEGDASQNYKKVEKIIKGGMWSSGWEKK